MSITPFFHVYHKYVFNMANINKIKLSGTTYNIQDENATKTVELTQAQYDALSVKDPNTFYIITDAQGADLSNYYTKSETSGATEISTALNAKQDTLVSSQNIKTINNESILGSGNITIEGGGGKAISAGTNISITTGETADTINCTLPITISDSDNGSKQSIAIGDGSSAHISNWYDSIAIGKNSKGYFGSVVIGSNPTAYTQGNGSNVAIGNSTKFYDQSVLIGSFAEGYNGYNANSVALGYHARATNMENAVAIGANVYTTGTTKTNINNQLKIDDSNQVYIYNKDNTEMICLQDALGGGGGKAVSAGTNIRITTGETADTINCTLPITTAVDNTSLNFGIGRINSEHSYSFGNNNTVGSYRYTSNYSMAVGSNNIADGGEAQFVTGYCNKLLNVNEFGSGRFNNSVSASATFGDSGNTLFSVGNGTADNARHNAFEIRQNGDIYITKDGQDVKLQDQLGGGGSTYTAGDGIDITNDIISVTGKVDTSAITTSITSASTDSQVPSAKAVYDQLGGLKLVKLSQSEYDALSTKDNSTLYVIVN